MTENDWDSDEFWEDVREPANPLPLLQKWYLKHCDGEWEHQSGIRVETCDNPGWWVKIDVRGTALDGKPFAPLHQNVSAEAREPQAPRWICCELADGVWNGAGDPKSLNRILLAFLDWAAAVDPGWPQRP